MQCPNCGSRFIQIQAVAEEQKRGCLVTGLWILLAICTVGLILLLFPLLMKKGSVIRSWATCQNCGYRWVVQNQAQSAPAPTQNQLPSEPRFNSLAHNVQCVLSQIIEGDISVSDNRNDWKILKTGLKYTMRSDIKLDDDFHDTLIELEFSDNTYQNFSLTRLQIDGNDIKTA